MNINLKLASTCLLIASQACADTNSKWYIQAGPAHVTFDEDASVSAGGAEIPGANLTLSDDSSFAFGLGYRFSDHVSIIGIVGIPPETTLKGSGSLAGLSVGKTKYGPSVFALDYRFNTQGAFQPFIGAGLSYAIMIDTKSNSVNNLNIENAFGSVIRVGFDYMISDNNGLFLSVNKLFVDTEATGTLAGTPVKAKIDLDPLVVHAGWVHRF
jgi:outer membrane protein